MGLETPQWISDLVASWPTGSETKSQGDDHLRAIKSAVKTTFPNADRAFYFPVAESISASASLDITDQHKILYCTTTGGEVAINLPALTAGDDGWYIDIVKISGDIHAPLVYPPSGSIISKSGSTTHVRVGVVGEIVRFFWTSSAWVCAKSGPMIGSVEIHDGAALPPGYLWCNGSAFNSTSYPELANVLGTNIVRDRRSRTNIGRGDMGGVPNGLLGAVISGNSMGAVGGTETHTLTIAELAAHFHTLNDPGHTHQSVNGNVFADISGGIGVLLGTGPVAVNYLSSSGAINLSGMSTGSAITGMSMNNAGSGAAHSNLQPSIITNMIIRGC